LRVLANGRYLVVQFETDQNSLHIARAHCIDIASCKPITSYPLVISDRINDAIARAEFGVFGHGYTYSAYPVPAAVAL
jgi:hypothetical protein